MQAPLLGRIRRWFESTIKLGFHEESEPTVTPNVSEPWPFREIANEELTEADIPRERLSAGEAPGDEQQDADWDTWSDIPAFAASFGGYEYWGSFEKCFEVGTQEKGLSELTLTELRTVLFCHYRAVCHDGYPTVADVRRARTLIAEIRDRVRLRAVK